FPRRQTGSGNRRPRRIVREILGVYPEAGRVRRSAGGEKMKGALIVLGGLLLIVLIFGGGLIRSRNELFSERGAINGAWSQVDVVLQRRNDLIPSLVETVKGFASRKNR